MTTSKLEHIGRRIKLYRIAKNMNMETLSRLIFKSKATVSKYERGQIAIDILTLFEIARALQIDISQLIDCEVPPKPQNAILNSNPFGTNLLHMYLYDGRIGQMTKSIIEVNTSVLYQTPTAMLYFNVASNEDYNNCEYLYFGSMRSFDTIVNFVLENQSNPIEMVLITLVRPFKKTDEWVGLMSGLSYIHVSPVVNKVIISNINIFHEEELKERLLISKEKFRMIKKQNAFSI